MFLLSEPNAVTCTIDGCNAKAYIRGGMCNKHYLRVKKYGDPHYSKINRDQTGKNCSVAGCKKRSGYKGMCQAHYVRMKKYGTTDDGALSEKYRRKLKWIEANSSHKGDDCLIWPFDVGDHGRGTVVFNKRPMSAPRAMCKLAHGEPPSQKHHASHSCGNGHIGCMNPKHLRWATPRENEKDKIEHGTLRKGQDINTNKLSENEVIAILATPKTRGSGTALARQYGVTPQAISLIRSRKNWAWLAQAA